MPLFPFTPPPNAEVIVTSSQNVTVPAWANVVEICAVSPGQGGAGGHATGGGGGGGAGGGYLWNYRVPVAPNAILVCTIGAASVGGGVGLGPSTPGRTTITGALAAIPSLSAVTFLPTPGAAVNGGNGGVPIAQEGVPNNAVPTAPAGGAGAGAAGLGSFNFAAPLQINGSPTGGAGAGTGSGGGGTAKNFTEQALTAGGANIGGGAGGGTPWGPGGAGGGTGAVGANAPAASYGAGGGGGGQNAAGGNGGPAVIMLRFLPY